MLGKLINYYKENKYTFLNRNSFKYCGRKVKIIDPLCIQGNENISIHDNVIIQYKIWLAAVPFKKENCILEIGRGCSIGHFNHIYATKEITIEPNVLIADRVYISDNIHEYSNPRIPIINQGVRQLASVRIGEGSWIGENVCIIGASVGKNCVIGANAVVTKNIPDFCVAVGMPAKVIKIFNIELEKWESI